MTDYKASKRIIGTSSERGEPYTEDMSNTDDWAFADTGAITVSYTHLTLPTKA